MDAHTTGKSFIDDVFKIYDQGSTHLLVYLTVLGIGTTFALYADVRLGISFKFLIPLTLAFTGFLLVVVPFVFSKVQNRSTEARYYAKLLATFTPRPAELPGPPAEVMYRDYRDSAKVMIEELSRADVPPQTKIVLLKLIHTLVHAESQRHHGFREESYVYNEGMYAVLSAVYGELEEVFNSLRLGTVPIDKTIEQGEVSSRRPR
jgi:hypothetical protein